MRFLINIIGPDFQDCEWVDTEVTGEDIQNIARRVCQEYNWHPDQGEVELRVSDFSEI